MADRKFLYATFGTALAFLCFILAAVTVALPIWAYFEDRNLEYERGYFSPWKTCVYGLRRSDRCGPNESHFKPSMSVWVSGITAYFGVGILSIVCVLSVLQLAMISSGEKVVMDYHLLIILKFACGILSEILSITTAMLFASQLDSSERANITRGPAFYIQVCLVGVNLLLFTFTIYDVIFSRKTNGDPTKNKKIPSVKKFQKNGKIAMTRSSGKPYVVKETISNGSMVSMSTVLSNVSTVDSSISVPTRSPLRSSLKKPSTNGSYNNGGFSPNSHQRNGSMKKVRIQTHSTEV